MTPDASSTTLAAAQANVLATAMKNIGIMNDALLADYMLKFDNWEISVNAGKIDNSNPPRPPASFTLGYAPDETGVRWATWIQNGPPICDMPKLPEDRSKPAAPPNQQGSGDLMNVPPGDHFPVGFEVTAPDGQRWQKQASITPFGTAYYYARVGSEAHIATLPRVAVWGT